MNRNQLAHEVSSIMADQTEADRAVKKTFAVMATALRNGEKVVISGFGAFTVKMRAPRRCRNPKTGESVMAGPRKSVRFKPSDTLLS